MDCRTFNSRLEDYLDDGLDFPGRFAMERHAQQCFRCGKTVSDAQSLRRIARQAQRVTAPPDFEALLMKRIQRENIVRGHRVLGFVWPAWRWAAAGTLAGTVLVTAILLFRPFPGTDQNTAAMKPVPAPSEAESTAKAAAVPILNPAQTPPIRQPEAVLMQQSKTDSRSIQSPASDFPLESVDAPDYVELLVPGPGDRMRVVRLPKTIRMRYGQASEQYFIRNVSH